MTNRIRIVVATNGRSLVGRDWLVALQYQFTPCNQITAKECISKVSRHPVSSAHSSEVNRRSDVLNAFPRIFRLQEKVNDHMINFE